jgi:protein TonB
VFEGFEEVKDEQARKRWFASTGTSLIIVVVVGAGLVLLARQQVAKAHVEKEIDVSFKASAEPELEKKPPPPPPPPVATKKAKRPGRAAPATVAVIPDAAPTEAEPTGAATAHETYDELGDGDETKAPEPPPPPPRPPPPPVEEKIPDPISEIDTAFVAARAMSGNTVPTYPESARKKGAEAVIKMKVRISATGEVTEVTLLSGDEPFAAAAIAAVKTWRYRPATDNGKAVASTRIVSIPFRLHSR